MLDHIVKLQKNYMTFVHGADCRTDIADRLYAADILNTEEKDEVCNISISLQERNRTLIKKLLRRSGKACKLFFEALKDAEYYELAIQMETTPISQQDIRLCQIGKLDMTSNCLSRNQISFFMYILAILILSHS